MRMTRSCVGRAAAGLMLFVGVAAAPAAPLDDFYKDKTISVIVGGSVGGGYDTLGRAIARSIGAHLPGHPSVVVQTLPGAGGLVAMDYLVHSAERDGTVMALVENGPPLAP